MKALITAAGRGVRSGLDGKLRKEMLPVYDMRDGRLVLRPMLDVIVTRFHSMGIDDIAVVLEPSDDQTHSYISREFPEVMVLHQEKQKGFGDAVLAGMEFIDDERFALNAGDGILLDEKTQSDCIRQKTTGNILTVRRVKNPENYGTARIDREGSQLVVREVVEKSANPPSDYALCAFYILEPNIFTHLAGDVSENVELTPAINSMIREGTPTFAKVVKHDDWVSVGRVDDYVRVLSETLGRSRGNVN